MSNYNTVKVYISDVYKNYPRGDVSRIADAHPKTTIICYVNSEYVMETVNHEGVSVVRERDDRVGTVNEPETTNDVIIYWNCVSPIRKFGRATYVFSIFLANDILINCPDIIFPHGESVYKAPIETLSYGDPKSFVTLKNEIGADTLMKIANPAFSKYNICMTDGSSTALKAMNLYRILLLLVRWGNETPQMYILTTDPETRNAIINKLRNERVRRHLVHQSLVTEFPLNSAASLQTINNLKTAMALPAVSAVTTICGIFKSLIGARLIVPRILQEVSYADSGKACDRFHCDGDNFSITHKHGLVPSNMPLVRFETCAINLENPSVAAHLALIQSGLRVKPTVVNYYY